MALGQAFFSDISASVSDLFQADADRAKAAGDRLEANQYSEAAAFADQNVQFTENSTAIQEAQANRSFMQTQGGVQADIAANGFANSGSALDILADSANQGALKQAVLQQQGLITEAGYKEQADSYRTMTQAANLAATAEDKAAQGAKTAATISGVAAAFALIPTPPGLG